MIKNSTIRTVIRAFFGLTLICTMVSGCDILRPKRPLSTESQPFKAPTMLPTATGSITAEIQSTPQDPQIANCTNNLVFLGDLTIPDGMQVNPGSELEKEWKVKNSGTCNWNESYSVRLVSGPDLGASTPQALVPARNGSEAVIRLLFTAPAEPGRYTSTWRAFGPDEKPFGEWFAITIVVTSP